MIVIFWLIMVAGLGFAVWIFLQTRHEPMIRRVVDVTMALATAGGAFMLLARTMQIGISDWNDAKLAPVVAMTRGYNLYQDPETGVMTGWIYGPIGAIALLPASMAKDPTTAGLIGSFIAVICFFGPAVWLFIRAARGRLWWFVLLASLTLIWRAIFIEDLCRCAFIASPDAPALGLAACACAFIYRRRTWLNLALSALAAILCVWTKQNFLPLLAGLIFWVLMTDGLKKSLVYLGMVIGIGAIVSGVLILSFGAHNMYFHMYWMPRQHPFQHAGDGFFWMYYEGIETMMLTCMPGIVVLGMAFLLDAWVRPPAKGVIAWFASRNWSVLLITSIFLIPSSLLGYMKVGGYLNNLACTDYFLFVGALCAALEACAEVSQWSAQPGAPPRSSSAQKWIMAIVSTVLGLQILPPAFGGIFGAQNGASAIWGSFVHPYTNTRQTIYKYILAHPNQVYCPWNPLITLMGDGKLYHFEWGLLDRGYAKRDPSMKQFRDHIPSETSAFVYIGIPQSTVIQHAIDIPLQKIEVQDLPGCTVFVRQQ